MIRVDKIWLAVEPMDMRAGPDTALARVIRDFGQAVPHHAYVFANKRYPSGKHPHNHNYPHQTLNMKAPAKTYALVA